MLKLTNCRTCAASQRSSFTLICVVYLVNVGDKDSLSLISGKIEWESPLSILVTGNHNWPQRSGTKTCCVKGRY